jgi:hypothetical protein
MVALMVLLRQRRGLRLLPPPSACAPSSSATHRYFFIRGCRTLSSADTIGFQLCCPCARALPCLALHCPPLLCTASFFAFQAGLPELAALNSGSLNYLRATNSGEWAWPPMTFENTVGKIQTMLAAMRRLGVVPECECFDTGIVRSVGMFQKVGILGPPYLVSLVMGVASGMPARCVEDRTHGRADGQTRERQTRGRWSAAGRRREADTEGAKEFGSVRGGSLASSMHGRVRVCRCEWWWPCRRRDAENQRGR